jgi:hypothetical protein
LAIFQPPNCQGLDVAYCPRRNTPYLSVVDFNSLEAIGCGGRFRLGGADRPRTFEEERMSARSDYNLHGIFDGADLEAMSVAADLVRQGDPQTLDPATEDAARRLIVNLYRDGLKSPEKLGEVAAFLATSRLFQKREKAVAV